MHVSGISKRRAALPTDVYDRAVQQTLIHLHLELYIKYLCPLLLRYVGRED
jgi:hypothetical protein